jgi:DegV family protein with EDD domain
MSKVAIVTDSTVNIPADYLKNYPIHIVPLQVIWGADTYRDSIDLQPVEFYARLKDAKTMPTTSQPSPAAFSETYRKLIAEGYDILSVHISSRLSGTVDSATQARQNFPGASIAVLDSMTTSMAMGFPILAAARAAAQGATLQDCYTIAKENVAQTGVLFAVSTLEFLRRGGRIGGAAALLGTALNLKPILELCEGKIEAVERIRTMSKAQDRLLDLFEERVDGASSISIAALHASAPQEAQSLLQRARERFDIQTISDAVISEVSPVLGTHTGPGCVGIAFMVNDRPIKAAEQPLSFNERHF